MVSGHVNTISSPGIQSPAPARDAEQTDGVKTRPREKFVDSRQTGDRDSLTSGAESRKRRPLPASGAEDAEAPTGSRQWRNRGQAERSNPGRQSEEAEVPTGNRQRGVREQARRSAPGRQSRDAQAKLVIGGEERVVSPGSEQNR